MLITKDDKTELVRKLNSQKPTDESLLSQFFTAYRKKQSFSGTHNEDVVTLFIERFVADIIASNLPGFRSTTRRPEQTRDIATPLGRAYFHQINSYLDRYSMNGFFRPPVTLFFSACKELHLIGHRFIGPVVMNAQGVTDAELFNQLIDRIRKNGRTPEYRKKVAKDNYRDFRKFRGLVNYVDALFEHVRSRLIVIRLDLRYRHESVACMSVGQAQDDLKHFFDNMRNKPSLFSDLVGQIWKLECGDHGSEHFHVMLFFTNDRLGNDCHRAEEIGEYWEELITKGRGFFFNCNRPEHKAKQKRLSLGRIEYYDHKKRYNLLYQLAYFCKNEQRIQIKPKKKSRTYGRGEMPQINQKRSGRPRSVIVLPKSYLTHGG